MNYSAVNKNVHHKYVHNNACKKKTTRETSKKTTKLYIKIP